MTPFDPREATIASIHAAIFSRSSTCREIVTSFLTRISALNPSINAIVTLNPHALELADELDLQLSHGRTSSGKLFGVPILLKDNYDTFDMPTTGGCLALVDLRPTKDGPIVAALRAAGAIILGKVNLHELALEGLSVSSLGGQTINPYDLTRTPGGSSGGSGAAVAASLAVWATGTDTVNSLRSPASANSLFSCRPTRGLISRCGINPNSHTQDAIGPITRCTEDLAVALTVMASTGEDAEDDSTAERPKDHRDVDYAVSLKDRSLDALRLGLIEGFFNRAESSEITPVNKAMEYAATILEKAGAKVVPLNDSLFDAAAILSKLDTQKFELREGLTSYLQQSHIKGQHPQTFEELFESGQFLVIPTQAEYIKAAGALSTSDVAYAKVQEGIRDLKSTLQTTFEEHNLDAIIYPQQKSLVVKIGAPSQSQRNGILAAVTGTPVVTVPVGFSPSCADAAVGIPIGMEILGRPWSEQLLLQIAYQFEQLTHVRRAPVFATQLVELEDMEQVPCIKPNRSNIHGLYPVGKL